MAGPLFTVIAGGAFLFGSFVYFGHPAVAVGIGILTYATARWLFVNY